MAKMNCCCSAFAKFAFKRIFNYDRANFCPFGLCISVFWGLFDNFFFAFINNLKRFFCAARPHEKRKVSMSAVGCVSHENAKPKRTKSKASKRCEIGKIEDPC